jgi:predicted transcriptional regulator
VAEPLKAGIRKQVYEAVRRYPGIHLRALERNLGVSAPLAQYHLKHLSKAGWVEGRDQGGYTRYWPTAKEARVRDADQAILGMLREEVPLHVALLLLDFGPMTHGALVERLGMAKSSVSYHLAKLAQANIVEREPKTARIRLTDPERITALLLAYNPTPDMLDSFADLWGDLYD